MLPALTDRENQILSLVASGLSNNEISLELSLNEAVVENHIDHIYMKLGISNRAQAVTYAFRTLIVLDRLDLSTS